MRSILIKTLAVACLVAATPIFWAADSVPDKLYGALRDGDSAALRNLLDHKISANARDKRGTTPLMYAAEVSSVEAMRILIEHGADVNAQNDFGATALMWSGADPGKVKLLIEHGADVNQVAKSGRTALMIAALSPSSAEAVGLLLRKGADVSSVDRTGVTVLLAAAAGNDTESIRMLVEHGADVNRPGTRATGRQGGVTPLMELAANGNVEGVKFLLAKGAGVNAVSERENLPQVKNGRVAAGGLTPLLLASTYGPPELVKTLLEAGADVNASDVRGMTPLMLSLTSDHFNSGIAESLRAHGADAARRSNAGETALDWARKLDDDRAFAALGTEPPRRPAITVGLTGHADPAVAVARSVDLLERTSANFFSRSGCFACHAQVAADLAVSAARKKGIAVDEQAARERLIESTSGLISAAPALLERQTGSDGHFYLMEALRRIEYPPNRLTDTLAAELAAEQGADGAWHHRGIARTPIQDSEFSRTAMAMRALQRYGTPGRADETKQRIERAARWLQQAEPRVTEDLAMRLVGLAAAGNAGELSSLAQPLLAQQRASGGWAQRPEWTSDAYATGMSLWALAEARVIDPRHPRYRKGIRFLTSTQSLDGSWHVTSRAAPIQPYFESGFPYGRDQWISMMATGWAASALAAAIEAP